MVWERLRGLFDAEVRAQKSIDKQIQRLLSKSHPHEERMAAIDALAQAKTPESFSALFRRFDVQCDKEREDRAEKDYLCQVLGGLGQEALPAFREHLERSTNVLLPVQAMTPVLGEDALVSELLRVLAGELGRVAAFRPERKVRLLQILSEHDDPRIVAAVTPALADFDESVRFEAASLLGRRGAEAERDALLDRYLDPKEDSARVKGGILAALASRGWSVEPRRDQISRALTAGWRIDAEGLPIRS